MPIELDQIWLPGENYRNGVQIVELNSSDNPRSSSEDETEDLRDPWMCVAEDLLNGTKFYKANHEARERRRAQRYKDRDSVEDMSFGELYDPGTNDPDHVVFSHINYFKILNNQFNAKSNSSSENEPDSPVDFNDTGNCNWDDIYLDSDVRKVDADLDRKRTIWIYSFKNKHLLSDNDFELVNIPSIDSSTSNDQISRETGIARVATPIPSSYVPRLNLSATTPLPNVTEVTEPTKHTSWNQTDKLQVHRFNSWIQSENATPHKENIQEQSNNVINWMSLSPRERKRKLRNKSPVIYRRPLTTVIEVANKEHKLNPETNEDKEMVTIETSAIVEKTNDQSRPEIKPSRKTIANTTQDIDEKIEVVDSEEAVEDRGDYNRKILTPKIHVPSHRKKRLQISDPLENLNSDNWILEEPSKLHKATSFNALDGLRVADGRCASRELHLRNSDLLKPVSWAQYLPITASVPSLDLSLTNSIEQSPCWILRAAKWFRCCR